MPQFFGLEIPKGEVSAPVPCTRTRSPSRRDDRARSTAPAGEGAFCSREPRSGGGARLPGDVPPRRSLPRTRSRVFPSTPVPSMTRARPAPPLTHRTAR
jgi:hypothetical protein